jgi:hypothetical protein
MRLMIILGIAADMILGMKWVPVKKNRISILITSVILKFNLGLGSYLGNEGVCEDIMNYIFEVQIKSWVKFTIQEIN